MSEGVYAAVVAALPEELAALRARLHVAPRAPQVSGPPGPSLAAGWLARRPVVLGVVGEGARRAAAGLTRLLAATAAERLVVVGFAGALSEELRIEELVLAREVRRVGAREARWAAPAPAAPASDATADGLAPDPALYDRAWRALSPGPHRATSARAGVVVSAPALVLEPSARRSLHARCGGAPASVVDLESAALAEAAARLGVPWMVLRAVTDTAADGLPALLAAARTPDGATDRARVLRGALVRPRSWPALLGLRRRAHACARRLADAVEEVLAWPAI